MKNFQLVCALLMLSLTFGTSCRKSFNEPQATPLEMVTPSTIALATETTSAYKTIKVNFFGGTNPTTNSEWNNWNTSSSVSSGSFKNSDGSVSTVSAAISQNGVSDNGIDYNSTMALKEVIRYASWSTSRRTLTISGLDSSKIYDLEIYASRNGATNNTTRFTVGQTSIDIKTDNNLSNTASFFSLTPSSGNLLLTIDKLNTYNYINGFTLREKSPSTTYTLQRTAGTEIYLPNASARGWKGGDTVRIPAGTYSLIDLGNFQGNALRPIVIINYGGQVIANQVRFGNNAAYFKFTGTGHPSFTYGFKINSAANAGVAIGLAHHVEVTNIDVSGTEVGFYFKKNPTSSDPLTVYPNYLMSNFYIHHNYIHDVHGEGMYIGHTYPNSDPYSNNLTPIRMDKVEIAYNTVDGTDWDGIQLSNARTGAKIHHNTVTNFGRINMGSQQAGIILGGNTTGDIYDNVVKNGTGNGIQAFGYGTIRIYNNQVENAGADRTTIGQESVFCNDHLNNVETNPKQRILFNSNTIKYPKTKGGIRVGGYNNYSDPSSLYNNTIYLPNAPINWESLYLITNVPGSSIYNNVVIR
jgi:hypothetical protein